MCIYRYNAKKLKQKPQKTPEALTQKCFTVIVYKKINTAFLTAMNH